MSDPPPSSRRPRVLLVDDDEFIRRALVRSFGERAKVLLAADAAQARELLRERPVDVVVSDYNMPGEDGLSLLAAIAAERPDLTLALFSAQPPAEAQRALAEGLLDALFQKPAEFAQLIAFVLRAGTASVAPPGDERSPFDVELSQAPLCHVRARRTPTDEEWAEHLRMVSSVLAAGNVCAFVFEVSEGASLSFCQQRAYAEWLQRHRDEFAAVCAAVGLVPRLVPGIPTLSVRVIRPLGVPVRAFASRDEATVWALECVKARRSEQAERA
ncbi:MAG: response regulator [Polyangiaceae bacterium]|nr:response regulator [Polyangiaceae bacterium]